MTHPPSGGTTPQAPRAMDCPEARVSLGVYVLGAIDPAERALVRRDEDTELLTARLVAAREIDNAQPAHPQCESRCARIADQKPRFVRATMAHRQSHRAHARFGIRAARNEGGAAYSAHATV